MLQPYWHPGKIAGINLFKNKHDYKMKLPNTHQTSKQNSSCHSCDKVMRYRPPDFAHSINTTGFPKILE